MRNNILPTVAAEGIITSLAVTAAALLAVPLRAKRAGLVTWLATDVLTGRLPANRYSVWHDRAVFHFLTDPGDRARYVAQTERAVRPGGHAMVASFGPDGPTRCSGLEVMRYSPEGMHSEFGASFRLLDSVREDHRTPDGLTQAFVYCLCRVGG